MVWNGLLVKRLFASGFVVFLTGVFLVINGQVERWSIVASGGTAALGHFYLALLFVNLYTMVPTSLDSLYLPKLVRSRVAGDLPALGADLGRFFLVSVAYATIVVAATLLLARPVVAALLPAYLADLRYVYLVLPGLVVFGLTSPLAIVFNVLIEYRFYFYAYGAGTLATLAGFAVVLAQPAGVSLDAAALIRTAVNLLMAVVLTLGYLLLARAHPEFRLRFPAALGGRGTGGRGR